MLGELADRVGLSSSFSVAVPWAGERAPVHDRGRLLAQVAVMLAAGGRCVGDMAALRDQPALFGTVASDPTLWRTFDAIDSDVLDGLRTARAAARGAVWGRRRRRGPVVLDVDASLVEIHSENKQGAASHYKGGYGFHPMFCFIDDGEALAGILRPGNAAANSGADQLAVVDLAIAQLPAEVAVGHGAVTIRARFASGWWCVPTPPATSTPSSPGWPPATSSFPSRRACRTSLTSRSWAFRVAAGGRRSTPTAALAGAPRSLSCAT
jgi:hypothetical protein